MRADRHPLEPQRLKALRGYEILDTPREAPFDDVADLAARICGTPIAVVNLIDAERQWFKAEVGLGTRELPLDDSICAHAILVGDYMEIPDTHDDPRMRDNPLCDGDPGLRFYAGAVLLAEGLPIGTLCVLDHVPRTLDTTQRHALMVLAAQVMAQLDLRAALRREAMVRKEIDHRVKNSLHSVAAFAGLQRRAATGDEARLLLRSVEQQVDTVALLHDLLARTDDQAAIDLETYCDQLAVLLARTAPGFAITATFAPLPVAPATAALIGGIVNELVANALKHSFAGGATGRITLSGAIIAPGRYAITCTDDGPGPAAAVTDGGSRLGMRIIAASVAQLGGAIDAGRTATGYRTTIGFPID